MVKYSIFVFFVIKLFSSNYLTFVTKDGVKVDNLSAVHIFYYQNTELLFREYFFCKETIKDININSLQEKKSLLKANRLDFSYVTYSGKSYTIKNFWNKLNSNELTIKTRDSLIIRVNNSVNMPYPIKVKYNLISNNKIDNPKLLKSKNGFHKTSGELIFYEDRQTIDVFILPSYTYKLSLELMNKKGYVAKTVTQVIVKKDKEKVIDFVIKKSFFAKLKSWLK